MSNAIRRNAAAPIAPYTDWKTAAAFGLGAGFQTAGDYYKTGEAKLGNSLTAGTTAAAALPLLGSSIMANGLIGGATLGTNAMVQNALFGGNESVALNYGLGLAFTGLGNAGGQAGTWVTQQFAPQWVRATSLNPSVPALLQAPAMLNPRPSQVGATADTFISNLPAFLDTSKQRGAQP